MKFLILAVFALQTLSGQTATATNCVHQAGDNPDWARPDFDDRQWSKQFPDIGSPYVWTRCRIDLSALPRFGPILISVLDQAPWELFVNGVPTGSHGDLRTGLATISFEQRAIPASAGTGPKVTVALRQLPGRLLARAVPFTLVAGSKDALDALSASSRNAFFSGKGMSLLGGAILFTIGFLLLLLFLNSKDTRQMELLWFGVFSLGLGSIRFSEIALFASVNGYWMAWMLLLNVPTSIALPRVPFTLAGKRVPPFYEWLATGVIGLYLLWTGVSIWGPITWAQQLGSPLPQLWFSLLLLLLTTAFVAAFWPFWRVPRPLRLASVLCLLLFIGTALRQVTKVLTVISIDLQEFGSNAQSVLILVSLCGLFVVIAQRHRKVALDRAELQGELRAAQEVQLLLTSSALSVAPWANVEVAYLPAKEVGGDFYFCRHTSEGQLVVVGDVSGKGLRAAMLASVALGSLRSFETISPARLLEGVNKALHGQAGGGFVTCCAVLLRADGQIVVANAGHLPPYVDGREFAVEPGLPLGIMGDAEYEEMAGKGERVTILSDGVVEAENAQRELLGFERTREVSRKSAQEIAEAAKAWGQNDDITVVTVRRKS